MAFAGLDLDGKIALVTGAGRGIGRAVALAMAEAGADLALASRTRSELETLAQQLRERGRRAEVFVSDVSRVAEVQGMVQWCEDTFGRIDILVNNAGAMAPGGLFEVTEATWDRVIDTNLKGPFFCAQAVAHGMVGRGSGKIVMMGSTYSVVGARDRSPYCASKGGVLLLTRALALDLAPYNVQVNAVGPAATETGGARALWTEEAWSQDLLARIPAGRFCTPEDVAGAVVYLSSPASDMVTGQLVLVDGGWTIQ
ncbi:MAG: glucose 1-dehydrogenase [Chloroflexi bacterium]|nr:glucose 1-dehydrogenase [Chloroflexota bacterium]